jgi:hypothetical protein
MYSTGLADLKICEHETIGQGLQFVDDERGTRPAEAVRTPVSIWLAAHTNADAMPLDSMLWITQDLT